MSKQQYFLAFLATNLLVALTNQSAIGFTLKSGNGATNYYNPTVPYVIDANTRGTTFLSPRYVAPIKLGGTNGFLNMLNNDVRWQGWDFISSDKNLYGNFEISDYYGCGAQTICAKERPKDTIRGGVGAYIDIKYNPKKTDPKPGKGKIHWIQHVVNNHTLYDEQQSTSGGGLHGVRYDGIDIPPFQNANPYYRGGNEFSSFDRPYRIDPTEPHTWFAELYLVEEIAPKTVKIYNGVRWGWINRVYRRPNDFCPAKSLGSDCSPPPPPPPCNSSSGGGGCNRTQADGIFDNENVNQENFYSNIDETNLIEEQEQPSFDINDPDLIEVQDPSFLELENWDWTSDEEPIIDENQEEDNSESPVSVPESTSALGLFALAAWGIVKALKIKKDK
jgi:hypothetical protein